MSNTLLGIVVMLVSTSVMNVGVVLQKKAVDRLPSFEQQPLLASIRGVLGARLWLLGWVMSSSAIVLNWVALGLADISVVQPLSGFGLVVLALASRALLGERLGPRALGGMAAVVVGLAVLGLTARESVIYDDPATIVGSYTHPAALATLAAFVLAVAVGAVAARRSTGLAGPLYALAAATASVVGLTFSKGLFGLFGLVGFGAALATLSAWTLALLLIAFSTAAMMLQQLSFQKGRAVVVNPIFAAASVVLPLLTGLLVFREQVGGATVLAAAIIVLGVGLLGARDVAAPGAPSLATPDEAPEEAR